MHDEKQLTVDHKNLMFSINKPTTKSGFQVNVVFN